MEPYKMQIQLFNQETNNIILPLSKNQSQQFLLNFYSTKYLQASNPDESYFVDLFPDIQLLSAQESRKLSLPLSYHYCKSSQR
jgi:hypothetical protein